MSRLRQTWTLHIWRRFARARRTRQSMSMGILRSWRAALLLAVCASSVGALVGYAAGLGARLEIAFADGRRVEVKP